MLDLLTLAAAAAAVFVVAALAQAITGFGAALVAVPVLTWLVDPVTAVVATTVVGLVLCSGSAWRERAHVDRPDVRLLSVTGLLGMPVGLVLIHFADDRTLEVGIAAATLVMVLLVSAGVRVGRRALPAVGAVSGALLTSTGMNGPPLVLALVDREPRRYRATLQAVFAVQDAAAVALFLALGLLDTVTAVLVAGGVVGLPLGWQVGDAAFRRISAHRLRPVTVGVLLVSATSVMVGALT